MNTLEFETYIAIIFGIYLILHGIIHSAFMYYNLDKQTGKYTGWSGDSWFLDKFMTKNYVVIFGKIIWIITILSFLISGFGALGVPGLRDILSYLIIISSGLSILGYLLFFNGMSPTPYQWLIGVLIDLLLIIYVLYFPTESTLFVSILVGIAIVVFLVIFITKVLPEFGKNKNVTVN